MLIFFIFVVNNEMLTWSFGGREESYEQTMETFRNSRVLQIRKSTYLLELNNSQNIFSNL